MKGPKSTIKIDPPKDDEPTLDVTGRSAAPESSVKPIQIKVPVSKHKEMKAYAAEQGKSMTEMIMAGYEMYRNKMK